MGNDKKRCIFCKLMPATLVLLICFMIFSKPVTTFAQTAFDASLGGSVIIGYDARACDGTIEGAVRYNSSSSCAEFCNGTSWTCPASGGGGCTVIWDALADETNTAQSTVISSDIEYVSTSGCASADISISGGGSPEYRICADSTCTTVPHTWGSLAGSIDNGEYVQTRLTSGASPGNTLTARLTLAETATDWNVTTANIPEFIAASTFTASWPATTSSAIPKPTGTAEDDLLIATLTIDANNINLIPPAGWTELRDVNTNTQRKGIFYKVAGASEPTSYSFNFNSDEFRTASIITIRNVDTVAPIDVNATAIGNSTQPTAPSITTTVNDTMLVSIAHLEYGETFTPPTDYTERVDIRINSYTSHSVATKIQSASGATGTAAFTASGFGDDWRAEHLAVRAP